MTVLGTPIDVVFWFAVAIGMSLLLPMYFGLKFEWDPSTVEEVRASEDREDRETSP